MAHAPAIPPLNALPAALLKISFNAREEGIALYFGV